MERAPILERKKWWAQMPVKHPHTYRRLPLEHGGGANKVSDVVVIRCHDRSFPLKIKMFLPANRMQKKFDGSESKEETADWEGAKAVGDIREALLNLADVMAELWPYDNSARILQRVLHNANFGAGLRCSDQEKVKLMVEFCDGVLRENACRAVEQEVPLSFRQAKERWADTTERIASLNPAGNGQNSSMQGQQNFGGRGHNRGGSAGGQMRGGGSHSGGSHGGGGPGASGNSLFRGGAAARGRGARLQQGSNSFAVCFNFNRGNCGRPPKGVGCDDGRGGEFAHVCNQFDLPTGKYCLQAHARVGNH